MSVELSDVDAYVRRCRERLEADRQELQVAQERVLHLTSTLFGQVQKYAQEEKENVPQNGAEPPHSSVQEESFASPRGGVPSHLSALFEEEKEFFPFREDEGRRKRLAQERRQEYNAFLRRKEEAAHPKKVVEEAPPRSILEAVDYEKVLARMKAQEAQFRNMNRAEPSLEESASSIPISPVQKYAQERKESIHNGIESYHSNKYPAERENDIRRPQSYNKKVFHAPTSDSTISKSAEIHLPNNPTPKRQIDTSRPGKKTFHSPIGFNGGQRRGGGGEPLRDSNGNLITTRGYVSFPSEQQNSQKNQQMSYREELRRQIEERRAIEEEQRRRQLEEDELLARRAEEQRLQMLREYEEEQRRNQRKSEQRDHERLRQLEEFQMREAALRQKRAPPPPEPVPEVPVPKEPEGRRSPPIPAVRSKAILNNTPPILMDVKPENVFSSLSEIRKSLMQEQPQKDFKNSYEVMNRRTVLDDDEERE